MEYIDFRAPRTPCQTEGCGHPNYHVCLYKKPDLFPVLIKEQRVRKSKVRRGAGRDEVFRERISEVQKERWAAIRAKNKERDAQIVARWNEEPRLSLRAMGELFGLSKNGIQAVLTRARNEGEAA